MAIQIDCKSINNAPRCSKLHHMPCRIDVDGSAKVEQYFECNMRTPATDLESTYRGRPLHGETKTISDGYTGVILKEMHKVFNDEDDRKFKAVHTFDSYTHWNLDRPTSDNDKIISANQWLDIAKMIHEPIEDLKENDTP